MEKDKIEDLSRAILRFYWLYNEKITRPMSAACRDTFTQAQFFVLSIIASSGTLPMSQLAERIQMPKQQLTKLINQLEDGGYVLRLRRKEDRRMVYLKLTDKAGDFMGWYAKMLKASLIKAFEALTQEETETFYQCLTRIGGLLEKLPSGMPFDAP